MAEPAVGALLDLLYGQSTDVPALDALAPAAEVARHARRFKLDVSVDLTDQGVPRMSINDTGEEEEFRRRLLETTALHGVEASRLRQWFALCAPGDAQATLSLKWASTGSRPTRTGLYFEELFRHAEGLGLWADAFAWAACPLPPEVPRAPGQMELGAICVDLAEGQVVALKDYWMGEDELPEGAPESLHHFLGGLPVHPRAGRRRFLYGRRFDPGGALTGYKVLWMTESTRPEFAAQSWRALSQLHRRFVGHGTPNLRRVQRWVADWSFAPECIPYPDLVSLNTDRAGRVTGLIAYISIK